MENHKIKLLLKDGTEIVGKSFGFKGSISGEVVFNTAMTGYPESLTDPSYKGQILVLTYPLIGNYGVPDYKKENEILKYFESEKIHLSGLVITDYSFESSHWNSQKTLSEWLIENKIPAIYGVDTRAITKHIRENGSMPGKLVWNDEKIDFADTNSVNLAEQVSTKEVIEYGTGKYKIILIDCGVKYNIIRRLLFRDTKVIRVPWNYDFTKENYDGLFISNGPGDPKKCDETISNISKAFKNETPIFGICLGNQIMSLASGGDTYKLKYGHRSHNQPVLQVNTNRCYITSQNHGYATDSTSLNNEWEELFINVNDQTNEGIIHKTKPFFSTQFHPEASSGPTDTDFLFDKFLNLVKKKNLEMKH
ncbi:MAG: carbamoyl phosphate synthase small subunit [Bacteroidetes bacterium GWA2_32_17]|nr:MAG: carbamoyl phosphate synthase small subunit [Bacteroidetes bacterium GWA2_32_17]